MSFWRANKDFEVKPIILKLDEDSTVIREEKVILSLKAETLGTPVTVNGEERGLVFFGEGDFLVNSRIRTYAGVYSKQYVDSFGHWGLIVGRAEKWSGVKRQFKDFNDVPRGFKTQSDFIKESEKKLHVLIDGHDTRKSIDNTDWFFKVKGEKDEATLSCKGGKVAFKGCHTKLAATSEEKVALNEGRVGLALNGDRIALTSVKGKLAAHGGRIASSIGAVSGDKIAIKGFAGKNRELANEARVKALSLLPKALEELGYRLE